MKKGKIIKFISAFFIIFPLIFFANTTSLANSEVILLQNLIFSVSLASLLIWPYLKKYYLILCLILIVVMVFLSTFKLLEAADYAGSTAFGIMFFVLLIYLPVLVKRGHINEL